MNEKIYIAHFPVNPNVLNLHFRQEWTQKKVEIFPLTLQPTSPILLQKICEIPKVPFVQMMKHKIRVRKEPEAAWSSIVPVLKNILQNVGFQEDGEPKEEEPSEKKKNSPLFFPVRAVYEGMEETIEGSMARSLFAIPGVTRVIEDGDFFWIRKGMAFSWSEIEEPMEILFAIN